MYAVVSIRIIAQCEIFTLIYHPSYIRLWVPVPLSCNVRHCSQALVVERASFAASAVSSTLSLLRKHNSLLIMDTSRNLIVL